MERIILFCSQNTVLGCGNYHRIMELEGAHKEGQRAQHPSQCRSHTILPSIGNATCVFLEKRVPEFLDYISFKVDGDIMKSITFVNKN